MKPQIIFSQKKLKNVKFDAATLAGQRFFCSLCPCDEKGETKKRQERRGESGENKEEEEEEEEELVTVAPGGRWPSPAEAAAAAVKRTARPAESGSHRDACR